MDKADRGTLGLIEQAGKELAELEKRVAALRALIDKALEAASADAGEAGDRFSRDPAARTSGARSVASHMALSGYSRENAEQRLRGTVSARQLRAILDEVYGQKDSSVRSP